VRSDRERQAQSVAAAHSAMSHVNFPVANDANLCNAFGFQENAVKVPQISLNIREVDRIQQTARMLSDWLAEGQTDKVGFFLKSLDQQSLLRMFSHNDFVAVYLRFHIYKQEFQFVYDFIGVSAFFLFFTCRPTSTILALYRPFKLRFRARYVRP
jgi:hypothetical protein